MTSKKYSADVFRHTFFNSLKSALPAALVTFFSALALTSGLLLMHIKEGGVNYVWNFEIDEGISFFFLNIIIIMSGTAIGMILYYYMLAKAPSNVLFSVPQSRTSMFLSKHLAGTLLCAFSTVIPILICGLLNSISFGNSIGIWKTALYISLSLFASMMFMFTLSAFVCCVVGSTVEAGYIAAFMLLPIALKMAFQNLASDVLYGSPYQNSMLGLYDSWILIQNDINSSPVVERVFPFVSFESYLMPIMFGNIKNVSRVRTLLDFNFDYANSFKRVLIFLAFTALIAIIACVIYNRRKAEKAGFLGASKLTTNAAIFSVSLLLSGLVSGLVSTDGYEAGIEKGMFLIFAVISLLVFAIVELFVLRSFKQLLKNLWMLAIHWGIVGVALLVVTLGLFGYSSKLPEADEVKSAAITTETGDLFTVPLGGGSEMSYNVNADAALRYEFQKAHHALMGDFTKKEDIEKIVNIHKLLIQLKGKSVTNETFYAADGERLMNASVRVSYTLKNGKVMNRMYTYASDTVLRELAELTKTDNYKEYVTERLTGEKNYISMGNYNQFYNDETKIALASPDFTQLTALPDYTNGDSRQVLLSAVAQDIKDDRLPLDMSPTSDLLGYIVLYMSLDEEKGVSLLDVFSQSTNLKIPVYSGMTNTVAVMKTSGLLESFESTKQPVEMRVCRYNAENSTDTVLYGNYTVNLFSGRICVDPSEGNEMVDYKSESQLPVFPSDYETVTDKEKIAEYTNAMRMYCPLTESGSYVILRYDDNTYVCGYVPDVLLNK